MKLYKRIVAVFLSGVMGELVCKCNKGLFFSALCCVLNKNA